MPVITIDKKTYEVKPGKNLLEACLSLGLDLPYFCWHPAMGSVGACRQCAVKLFKDEQDSTGRLVMSCMEPVKDGLFLSVNDKVARSFREQVIEWLMTNHPHDCAVCDEGGSCHLQDMTVMTGHDYRRFRYKKRTYKNQYLGPLLNHEMNRCIQCYRCVRFYRDYAGGNDLNVFAAHHHVYFGREKDGVLESEFSGNLAEVCPTGVFTDKTLKQHYTRKWDLTMAPTVCHHCSLGCNIIGGERYGTLRQITSRYNGEVNGYFICDRGRFGYEFVNHQNRIKQPLIRNEIPEAVDERNLLDHLKDIISQYKIIGIGSPRASLESNFALYQLVGKDNFYQGVNETEARMTALIGALMQSGFVTVPSLSQVEDCDAIIILGEDITNTAPMLDLAVRQAVKRTAMATASQKVNLPGWHDLAVREVVQESKGFLFIATPLPTKLDEMAWASHRAAPVDIARLGFAIANQISGSAPAVDDLEESLRFRATEIAIALQSARNPLIISGLSTYNENVIQAVSNITSALFSKGKKANAFFALHECNSMGLAMMQAPDLDKAFESINSKKAETVIIIENDVYRRWPGEKAKTFFSQCKNVIVLDHLHNATTQEADLLIPVGTFAEGDGTLINNEGRAQRFLQVFMPGNEYIKESWRWVDELRSVKEGVYISSTDRPDGLLRQLAQEMPWFDGVQNTAPGNDFRIHGQKIPREPHRYSGRTAMLANLNVSEPKPPEDRDTPLSFTMEGYRGMPPSSLIPFYWSPGWNSVQAINKYQIEVGGPLHGGDPGIRLIKEAENNTPVFFTDIPPAFTPAEGKFLMIPAYHIFGSDELSAYSNAVRELCPEPYIGISSGDAERMNLKENEKIRCRVGGEHFELPVKLKPGLPSGLAVFPVGLQNGYFVGWKEQYVSFGD